MDIKNKYERRLREEKEANLRLKGETGIMRKKVNLDLCLVRVNRWDHGLNTDHRETFKIPPEVFDTEICVVSDL